MKNKELLFCEDDMHVAELIIEFLEDEGFKVHFASDGKDGLELYKKIDVDVVITDIKMPNMDGIELSNNIKMINENQKIVIVSACDLQEYNNLLNITNNIEFLSKPIILENLLQKLL